MTRADIVFQLTLTHFSTVPSRVLSLLQFKTKTRSHINKQKKKKNPKTSLLATLLQIQKADL